MLSFWNIGQTRLWSFAITMWQNADIYDQTLARSSSKDDASNNDQAVATFSDIIRTKQQMKLGHILTCHGLHAGHDLIQDLCYEITIPQAEKIMDAQTGQNVAVWDGELRVTIWNDRKRWTRLIIPSRIRSRTIAEFWTQDIDANGCLEQRLDFNQRKNKSTQKVHAWDSDVAHKNQVRWIWRVRLLEYWVRQNHDRRHPQHNLQPGFI